MSDERCGSCGAESPFLINPRAQRPQGEDPSRARGIALVTVSLQRNLNEPFLIWGTPFYGFTVLSFSSDPTQFDLYLGKPQRDSAGTFGEALPGTVRGLRYKGDGQNPCADSLWGVKTGSSENRTALIAIATRPGALESWNPVYLTDNNGNAAHVSNFDSDSDVLDTFRGLLVNARLSHLNGNTWNRSQGGTATDDSDFAAALSFIGANARIGMLRAASGEYVRASGDLISQLTGESQAAQHYLRVASAIIGRDTSDSTMRAIESRVYSAGQITNASKYSLLTESLLRCIEANSTSNSRALHGDLPSNVVNGRAPSAYHALWTNSLDAKYDVENALITPTAMERQAAASITNAAGAGQAFSSLDARGLTNKSIVIVSDVATTVDLQVWSVGAAAYVTVAAGIVVGVGVTLLTALQHEVIRAFRIVRVITAAAYVGTVTVTYSAQGA